MFIHTTLWPVRLTEFKASGSGRVTGQRFRPGSISALQQYQVLGSVDHFLGRFLSELRSNLVICCSANLSVRWRFSVAVTRWFRSTQLLYI